MLTADRVSSGYGLLTVVRGVTLEVGRGEIVTVLGANGAGKTTLMKTLVGLLPCRGEIKLNDDRLDRLPVHRRVRLGVSLVPEGRSVFAGLSVMQNLILGTQAWRSDSDRSQVNSTLESVLDVFPLLRSRSKQQASSLSGGEQQMLAIGRALMSRPKLILLDEPSLGLAPRVVAMIFEVLYRLNQEQQLTMLLVEQNATMALQLASRAYVMESGRITHWGDAKILATDPVVRRAYLSVEAE